MLAVADADPSVRCAAVRSVMQRISSDDLTETEMVGGKKKDHTAQDLMFLFNSFLFKIPSRRVFLTYIQTSWRSYMGKCVLPSPFSPNRQTCSRLFAHS